MGQITPNATDDSSHLLANSLRSNNARSVERASVALVHDFLWVYGGAERVLKSFHEIFPDAPIYTMIAEPEIVEKYFPKATIITSPLQKSFLRSKPQWLLPWMPQAIESFDFSQFDVVLSSSGAFSHGVITGPDTTHICYCHSPMRYAWDWHAEYLLEKGWRSPVTQFLANQVMNKLRLWDAVSAKRVDQWLANSKTVQARIKRFYQAESTVLYPPVDTDFFDPKHATSANADFAFTVSRLTKNKKVDQIIRAVAAARIPLEIAGDGEERTSLQELATNLKANVRFLGRISEEEKREKLKAARCFIFAAEDDFGIAPVEALALGTPVVALGKGGVLETITSGENGILYPEQNVESLTEALQQFMQEGVTGNEESIRKSAVPFSKGRFAEEIRKLVANA